MPGCSILAYPLLKMQRFWLKNLMQRYANIKALALLLLLSSCASAPTQEQLDAISAIPPERWEDAKRVSLESGYVPRADREYDPGLSDAVQTADAVTTAVGLFGAGASEANPLLGAAAHPAGMLALAGGKLLLAHHVRQQSPEVCRTGSALLTGLGAGAATNNLLVIAGSSAAGPVGLAVGLGMLAYAWEHGTECES